MPVVRERKLESGKDGGESEKATDGVRLPVSLITKMPNMRDTAFPTLIIDRDFKIKTVNRAAKKLFKGFFRLEGRGFIDLFGKYFEDDKTRGQAIRSVREIREAVLDGKNGYSWRGRATVKSREHPTMTVNVYISPAQGEGVYPLEFIVMFDDVTEENRVLTQGIFSSLLGASKLKDNDTGEHITRVNYYSEALAKELFNKPAYPMVDADFVTNIGFLAAMHDVGKIGTPDDILNKEGPLDDREWNTMREHTKNGAFILDAYPDAMAKEIALSHHERWDGKGYPYKISGEMIPLAARIVSIADVYDALRMKRSYKPAFTHSVAMSKMKDGQGTQFDPALFEMFESMADKFNNIFEEHKDSD